MNSTLRLLAGIGLGAGAMYVFDPVRGRGRRALARDRVHRLGHEARDAAEVVARDAANRARGLWAETRSAMFGKTPGDRVLADRVRSRMGRYISHPRAVAVAAADGKIILSGPILDHEIDGLLACVERVPGVREVENRLESHRKADRHPALRGGVPRTGTRGALFQGSWSPTLRAVASAVGVGLMGDCLVRQNRASGLLGTVGFGLLLRAATNTPVGELVGRALHAVRERTDRSEAVAPAGTEGAVP